jgi:methionyl-tRNA formyltransferase
MKKLDQFILKSFIGPFFAILAITIFILVMQFLWLYIDELVGKGLELKVILEFLMWGSCQVLPLALPLATLLASMMTFGDMGEHYELTAMNSAGVSLARILLPAMVASALIAVAAFFIGDRLVPYSINQIYTMRDDIGRTKSEIKIPVGTFYDGIEGYILRIDDRDKETGMMYGVMVYDHTSEKGNLRLTVADSGLMKMSKAKDYLTFQLWSGTNYQETNVRKYRDTSLALQRIHFARQEMVIPLENYSFQHSDSARYGEQVRSMSNEQLRHGRDSLAEKSDAGVERFLREIRSSYALQWQSQLDSGWKDPGKKPYDIDRKPESWDDPTKLKYAYETALSNVNQLQSTIQTQGMEAYEYSRLLRLSEVEIWKKYAQALACFILFFIGAPIGSLIRKGGLGTPAVVSILFFVLYWVVDISGTKLARDGAATPFIGNFISAFVLVPIGVFLTWMAIREKSINLDAFKTWRRKLFSKIVYLFRKTRIVYMGTPEFAVAPLDALVKGKYKVVGVVTVADKPSGRGLKVNESAVKKYATAHGIPVLQPDKLKDPAFLEALAAWKADLFVVVGFRMLPEVVWKMPKMGTFNLHAALLPQYRGAAPINWAVINGEKLTGVTTFMIDQKIDTGGILLRQECAVEPTDTAGDVHDKLMAIGADLVVQTVEGLIQKNVETRVQRSFVQGSEVLKPAPKLTRELQHIDWDDTTKNVYNLVRGLSPFPGAFTELVKDGQATQLKVFFGEMRDDLHAAPGTVLSDGKTYLAVATRDGALALTDVQLAGKKRMDIKAFLLGFRDPETYTTTQGTSKGEVDKTRPAQEE